MKINNKLSRKRALKDAKRQVIEHDGTEILATKEARTKQRRWSFSADVTLFLPTKADMPAMPIQRTLALDTISYGDAKQARADCKAHEEHLRGTNQLFATAKIRVKAKPHETVSATTMRQLNGYRDTSMLLDRALEIAIKEAELVANGRSVGSVFMTGEANAEAGVLERTVLTIKQDFYKQAMDQYRAENEPAPPPPPAEVEEERPPFVPEIVNQESVVA